MQGCGKDGEAHQAVADRPIQRLTLPGRRQTSVDKRDYTALPKWIVRHEESIDVDIFQKREDDCFGLPHSEEAE